MHTQSGRLHYLMLPAMMAFALPSQASLVMDDVEIEVRSDALAMPLSDSFVVGEGTDWSGAIGGVLLELDFGASNLTVAFTNTTGSEITMPDIAIALADLEWRFERGPRAGEVFPGFLTDAFITSDPLALEPVLILDVDPFVNNALTLNFDGFVLAPDQTASVNVMLNGVKLLIPEPATLTLLALGLGGIAIRAGWHG